MKKIVRFLLVAFIATLAVVSCKKSNVPQNKPAEENKENSGENGSGNNNNNSGSEEEVKLAVDGKFGEWADISAIPGDEELSGILVMKTQVTDAKLFFYIEADAAFMDTDVVAYANYLTLCLDTTGEGSEKITYWGGETGSAYDLSISIWLMQSGKANMACWDHGFAGKAKLDAGIYKAEFSFNRTDDALKSKDIYFGAYLTDQSVAMEDGSEVWLDGETVGFAPAQGEDMVKVK